MLVVVSSWNLSIFIRLRKASRRHDKNIDDIFNLTCDMSDNNVKVSYATSIVMYCISMLLFATVCFLI